MSDEIERLEAEVQRLTAEVQRLTAFCASWYVERYGGPMDNPVELRYEVKRSGPALVREATERIRDALDDRTPKISWTGRNCDEIRQFVDGRGTVLIEGTRLRINQNGMALEDRWLGAGTMLAIDPDSNRLFVYKPAPVRV